MKGSPCATPEGTIRYRLRFADRVSEDHFRSFDSLWLSSLGLGTYLGHHDDGTDAAYRDATLAALDSGCNVLDTAINYRCMRSERNIGQALREWCEKSGGNRDEVVVATKGGFIPFDGAPPSDPVSYFDRTFVRTGVAAFDDMVAGCHCIAPRYLQHQVDQSLRNLDLDCIDVYYVHNPETQLEEVTREEFLSRLREAFRVLEENVAAGKIRMYGTATWNGYRVPPNAQDHLSLEALVTLARDVAGEGHHFQVVQLPFNLAMPEAFAQRNQTVQGEKVSLLEAARRLGIYVMASASIYQGNLARNLPTFLREVFAGLQTDAQRALQFVRSTPGLGTALVGMKERRHVEENLSTGRVPALPLDRYIQLYRSSS